VNGIALIPEHIHLILTIHYFSIKMEESFKTDYTLVALNKHLASGLSIKT
jgi:hypothetical protein